MSRPADAIVSNATRFQLGREPGTTFHVIEAILQSAGAAYGIEGQPRIRSSEPVDFGRKADRSMVFDGMRLRHALDTLVDADARYRWFEEGDCIVVRAITSPGGSALDAPIDRFEVANVSFIEALAALGNTIDPSRLPPEVARFALGFGDLPRFSVTLSAVTLLEALSAIAAAHGALSWSVRYDDEAGGLRNASITFFTQAGFATSPSPRAALENSRVCDPNEIVIPVFASIATMVEFYQLRSRVQVGLERLPVDDEPSFPDVEPLTLTGLAPAAAIARIVECDSRYTWSKNVNIFNIPLKEDCPQHSTVLEKPIGRFSVQYVTPEAALDAIVEALNGIPSGSGSDESDVEAGKRRKSGERSKLIAASVTNANLSEILNAVCRAHGALSWTFQAQGEHAYAIGFYSPDRWSIARMFRLRTD